MTVFETAPVSERPDGSRAIIGSEGQQILQDNQKVVQRTGAPADQADFDIDGFDLDGGTFDLSAERSDQITGDNPDIGGSSEIGIFVESSDDAQFNVVIEWKGPSDTTVGTVDQNVDSDLLSSSPSSGNHVVYVVAGVASDRFNVVITDETNGPNTISGSINAH